MYKDIDYEDLLKKSDSFESTEEDLKKEEERRLKLEREKEERKLRELKKRRDEMDKRKDEMDSFLEESMGMQKKALKKRKKAKKTKDIKLKNDNENKLKKSSSVKVSNDDILYINPNDANNSFLEHKRKYMKRIRHSAVRGEPVEEKLLDANISYRSSRKIQGVRILPLGGLGSIGMNMHLIETDEEMLIIDVGRSIGGEFVDLLGGSSYIADFRYVLERKDKLKGVILSHGHDDHVGAIKSFLYYIDTDIYGSEITLIRTLSMFNPLLKGRGGNFLEERKNFSDLIENFYKSKCNFKYYGSNFIAKNPGDEFNIGKDFKIKLFHVNHSIEGSLGIIVSTEYGNIVYTGDYKVDLDPLYDKKIDFESINEYNQGKKVYLMSDSTNSRKGGRAGTEREVYESLKEIFKSNEDKEMIFACFATSSHRIRSIASLTREYGRPLILEGSSLEGSLGVLYEKLGYFDDLKKDESLPPVRIVTGSQGEEFSYLYNLSKNILKGKSTGLNNPENVVLIMSSSVIPGNERNVDTVLTPIKKAGIEVITNKDMVTHASGHGYREDIRDMIKGVNPDVFIPIHGELSHQIWAEQIAREEGVNESYILENGQYLDIRKDKICLADESQKICLSTCIEHRVSGKPIVKEDMVERVKLVTSYDYIYILDLDNNGKVKVIPAKINNIGSDNLAPKIELAANHALNEIREERYADEYLYREYLLESLARSGLVLDDSDLNKRIIISQDLTSFLICDIL